MASTSQDTPHLVNNGHCHVIPVHGTWGAGFWHSRLWDLLPPDRRQRATRWLICDKLQETGIIIHPTFTWSGRNNHHKRLEAGKELAAYIAALKLHQSDRLFLVTHSHGGNVALYALKHPGTERVEGIVFMATPFLLFQPQDFNFVGLRLSPFSIATVLFAVCAGLFIQLARLVLKLPLLPLLVKPSARTASDAPTLASYLVAGIIMGLAGVIAFRASQAFRVLLRKTEAAWGEIKELSERYQPPAPHGPRVLILRKASDEVPLLLESGHLFEALLTWTWRALSRFEAWARIVLGALESLSERYMWAKLMWVLLVVVVLVLFLARPAVFGTAFGMCFAVIIGVTYLLVLIQACFLMVILLLNVLRFGPQPARGRTAFIRVTSEATPLGLWEVETFPAKGFAHSEIHEDPHVAAVIAKWLVGGGRREHDEAGA